MNIKQIHFIITLFLILFSFQSKSQRKYVKNNISLMPIFYGSSIKDSVTSRKYTAYIGVIRIGLERKIFKETYLNFTPNFSFSLGNTITNGLGFGFETGLRKYWNIEIYNRKCKPILRDRFLLSSKFTFINNSYYFDRGIGNFKYFNSLYDYGVNLFPICIDLKIYKKIYFTYQYNIQLSRYSPLKNHNIGFSLLFN